MGQCYRQRYWLICATATDGKALTSVSTCRRDVLVREAHVVLVLAPVFRQTPRGLVLSYIVTLLDLLLDPGEPPDVRRAVSEVGVAEAVDLGLVLDRLHFLDVRRQNRVPETSHHQADGVRRLRRDDDLQGGE